MELPVIEGICRPYKDKIADLEKENNDLRLKVQQPHRSTEINEYASALAKAQEKLKDADIKRLNSYNLKPFVALQQVLKAAREALSPENLSFEQKIITDSNGVNTLHTIVLHSSGQWSSSWTRLSFPNNDIDGYKSYVATMKRIALSSHLGIATCDDDDDGVAAMREAHEEREKGTKPGKPFDHTKESMETVNQYELDEIQYTVQDYPDIAEDILKTYHIATLAEIPRSQYRHTLEKIRTIIRRREET